MRPARTFPRGVTRYSPISHSLRPATPRSAADRLQRLFSAPPSCKTPIVNIQIRFTEGNAVTHYDITSHSVSDQILEVSTAEGDSIFYSPTYWQAYVIDPHADDPLGVSPEVPRPPIGV